MAQTNIIELNGKRYDAKTGAVLGKSLTIPTHISTPKRAHQGRAIDGFMQPAARAAQAHVAQKHTAASAPKHVSAPTTSATMKKIPMRAKTSVKPIAAHQPQKSKILMRSAVPKPQFTLKTAIKTQAPTEMMAKPVSAIVPKASAYKLDPRRSSRAQSIARSQHIKRFAPMHAQKAAPTTSTLPAAHHIAPARVQSRPLSIDGATSRPSQAAAHTTKRQPANKPDIFETAIAEATSHTRQAPKVRHMSRRARWFKLGAGAVLLLAVSGTIAWTNRTNLALHFASVEAGFHAAIPAYAPDGYTMTGGVQTSNGKVTVSFRSGDGQYTLTQEASNWDSATLRASTVALANGDPQTLEAAGRTVYLYGDGDATWVDGGVHYSLASNNDLSTSEISNLVASI